MTATTSSLRVAPLTCAIGTEISGGWLPTAAVQVSSEFSRWCLVSAIAGIGMKAQFKELASVGLKPALLMLSETIFLAVLVLALLRWAL